MTGSSAIEEAVAAYERYVTQKPTSRRRAGDARAHHDLRSRLGARHAAGSGAPPPARTESVPCRAEPGRAEPAPPGGPAAPTTAARRRCRAAPRRHTEPGTSLRRSDRPRRRRPAAAAVGAGLLGSVKSDYDAALGPSGCRPCSDDQIAPLEIAPRRLCAARPRRRARRRRRRAHRRHRDARQGNRWRTRAAVAAWR